MTKQESLDFLDNCIEYINHLSPKEISDIFTSFDKNNENLNALISAFEIDWRETMSIPKAEMETTTNYMYGDETFTMSSSERKWINRIKNILNNILMM